MTSARRAYELADYYRERGTYIVPGRLHVTSLPKEAERHADTIFLGPGEDMCPMFLTDFRAGRAQIESNRRSALAVGFVKVFCRSASSRIRHSPG